MILIPPYFCAGEFFCVLAIQIVEFLANISGSIASERGAWCCFELPTHPPLPFPLCPRTPRRAANERKNTEQL